MKLINKFTVLFLICGAVLGQQTTPEPFKPTVGQAGKDVVWVPTPQGTVDKMLEVAKVTPEDYVIDLGSGDGRNVITAARLGARALGVEWNQDMVDLSKRLAAEAGVSAKAQFLQDPLRRTPVFVHCHSGNRVGALMVPWLVLDRGWDVERALAGARAGGLRTPALEQKALDYVRRRGAR